MSIIVLCNHDDPRNLIEHCNDVLLRGNILTQLCLIHIPKFHDLSWSILEELFSGQKESDS